MISVGYPDQDLHRTERETRRAPHGCWAATCGTEDRGRVPWLLPESRVRPCEWLEREGERLERVECLRKRLERELGGESSVPL